MRLIVVEDQAPALRLLSWGLQEEGFTVDSCPLADIAACIARLDETPSVALINVLCDLADKAASISAIRAAGARHVVDLCGAPGEDCGADAVVDSPYKLTSIVEAIKRLLATA